MKLREANWLTWPMFTYEERVDYWFTVFLGTIINALAVGLGTLSIAMYVNLLWGIVASVIVGGLPFVIPHVGKLHVLHGIKNADYYYMYDDRHALRNNLKEYLELPAEDRSLFPADLIETAKNPLLSDKQRSQLDLEVKTVLKKINERNLAREAVAARTADISPQLETLKHARELLASDIKTYEEFR